MSQLKKDKPFGNGNSGVSMLPKRDKSRSAKIDGSGVDGDMSHIEPKQAMTPTERKRNQRERDKSHGFIEITVKVPADKIGEVRRFCQKLSKPAKRAKSRKTTSEASSA